MPAIVHEVKRMMESDTGTEGNAPYYLKNWTTRDNRLHSNIGYERYNTPGSGFAPFGSTGAITAIGFFTRMNVPYCIIEADRKLMFVHETSGGSMQLCPITSDWSAPTVNGTPTSFIATKHGIVVVNGRNHPLVIDLLPLGNAASAPNVAPLCFSTLGYTAPPESPELPQVNPKSQNDQSARGSFNQACVWIPAGHQAPGVDTVGLGTASNAGADDYKPAAQYEYKIANVKRDGSVGPYSSTKTARWSLEPETRGNHYAQPVILSDAPMDVIARRIYRTRNTVVNEDNPPQESSNQFYFIDDCIGRHLVEFWDTTRINALQGTIDANSIAPDAATSVIYPAGNAACGAWFQSRLFLAGNSNSPDIVFCSTPNTIHQFALTDRFQTDLGQVVALQEMGNALFVFGSHGLGYIQANPDGSNVFQKIDSIYREIAPKSICSIPGVGLVFLTNEGLFVLTRADGGFQVRPMLSRAKKFVGSKIARSFIRRACGVYDSGKKEYSVYFTPNGKTYNCYGITLHFFDGSGTMATCSVREGFPVGCIAMHNGWPVFGHSNPDNQRGLFVISNRATLGEQTAGNDGAYTAGALAESVYHTGFVGLMPSDIATTGKSNIKTNVYLRTAATDMILSDSTTTTAEIQMMCNHTSNEIRVDGTKLVCPPNENTFGSILGDSGYTLGSMYWIAAEEVDQFMSDGAKAYDKKFQIKLRTTDTVTLLRLTLTFTA